VVDDGEPTLEECLKSLAAQALRPRIIVVGGPRTNYEVAKRYADEVLGPVVGPGRARLAGIMRAEEEYIISCDADCIYDPHYVEEAVRALQAFEAVRAGWVEPRELSLAALPEVAALWAPYEFALAFRKSAFLREGLHLEDYGGRGDIGRFFMPWGPLRPVPVFTMRVRARLPTYGTRRALELYGTQLVLGSLPIPVSAGLVAACEAAKLMSTLGPR
jgi:glycosyltransferase involved in cell wall biosynthesis